MEKRNIQVSLQEAKDWYNCGNETLRLLALQAYTKKELESLDYSAIIDELCKNCAHVEIKLTAFDEKETKRLIATARLSHVALYLNKGWTPDWSDEQQTKYRIYYDNGSKLYLITSNEFCNVGTIYFKSKELAQQAIEILGKENLDNIYK